MARRMTFLNRWSLRLLSVVRIIAALLFMQHGAQKLFGFHAMHLRPFHLFSLMGLAGVIECVGGLLLFVGLFTRPVAFILSGEMAVAYFIAHAPKSFWPIANVGELAVLNCFLFLYLAAAGGGVWSLDRVLKREKS